MGANPYIHIPKESWPNWTWYAIECVILIAVSLIASSKITDSIEGLTPEVQNYMFIGFLGIFFFVWYVGIRRFVLTKVLKINY